MHVHRVDLAMYYLLPVLGLAGALIGFSMLLERFLPLYRKSTADLLSKRGFHVGLESLRGVLASAVVIHHAYTWRSLLRTESWELNGPYQTFLTQLGTAPVTMFFFLTGFLFWSRLRTKPRPPFSVFVRARLLRLGPAYLGAAALLFLLVAVFTHFHAAEPARQLLKETVAWCAFTLLGTPLVNRYPDTVHLWVVVWTLKLEMLFYLCIPFLGFFAQRFWRTAALLGALGILCYSGVFEVAHQHNLHGLYILESLFRYIAFVFGGGMTAAFAMDSAWLRRFARTTLASFVVIALVGATMILAPSVEGPLESALLWVPFVLIAAGNEVFGMLRRRVLLFLGQISYSLYLVHCLVLGAFLSPLHLGHNALLAGTWQYWAFAAFAMLVIVGTATVWHRVFEWPYLRQKQTKQRAGKPPQSETRARAAVAG